MSAVETGQAAVEASIVDHLAADMLAKAGIIAVAVIVVGAAMVILWRVLGRK